MEILFPRLLYIWAKKCINGYHKTKKPGSVLGSPLHVKPGVFPCNSFGHRKRSSESMLGTIPPLKLLRLEETRETA